MENKLRGDHVLLYCPTDITREMTYIAENFCGRVVVDQDLIDDCVIVYFIGNVDMLKQRHRVLVIYSLCTGVDNWTGKVISIGEVPIRIHNAGVFFRQVFNGDYYQRITTEHQFQMLTESNKSNTALRKGIYLSNVEGGDGDLTFNLLRCSTNLSGPTDNLRTTDREILKKVNSLAEQFYEPVELNHVLAQIYDNSSGTKARIKAHSDKTKDMPTNGLIAFVTFYDDVHQYKWDGYDRVYKSTSVLTRLKFRSKVPHLPDFEVVLYPGSVFIISLETNRLYTHEICPSTLPYDMIPTRLGYVVRCSKTKAIYRNGNVYLADNLSQLHSITPEDTVLLKEFYIKENLATDLIVYPDINFSMNMGDYCAPNV